jgi:hypothetical protein
MLSWMASLPPGQAMRPAWQTRTATTRAAPHNKINNKIKISKMPVGSTRIWQVRLHDDPVNYQEWIAVCLVTIAGGTSEWQSSTQSQNGVRFYQSTRNWNMILFFIRT